MFTDNDIIDAARECLDTKFLHQGRIVGVGLDCVGVVVHVAKRLNINHFDESGYSYMPTNGILEQTFEKQECLERISDILTIQKGDILMFRIAREPQHVAIFTGENIIHSYSSVEKVCEHSLEERWKSRIVRVYRFKDMQKG